MSITQLFDYIEHVVSDPIEIIETQYVSYLNTTEIFGLPGSDAADKFSGTIATILKTLERRLEGEILSKNDTKFRVRYFKSHDEPGIFEDRTRNYVSLIS